MKEQRQIPEGTLGLSAGLITIIINMIILIISINTTINITTTIKVWKLPEKGG